MNLDKAKAIAKTHFPALVHSSKRLRNAVYMRRKTDVQWIDYHGFQMAVPSYRKLFGPDGEAAAAGGRTAHRCQ